MNHTCLYFPAAERHRTLAGTHFPSRFFYSRHVIILTTFFISKTLEKWHTQQQIKMTFSFVML